MEDEHSFSVKAALEELDKQIEKVTKELSELDKTLASTTDVSLISNNLFVERAKKNALLVELTKKRETIVSQKNYVREKSDGLISKLDLVSSRDQKIVDTDERIAAAEAMLAELPQEPKNLYVFYERKNTEHLIKTLKDKKGRLESRQKRVTNRRLKAELRKITARAKNTGKLEGNTQLFEKYHHLVQINRDQFYEAASNNKKFQALKYLAGTLINYGKEKLIELYLGTLEKKNGMVEGFNKLPDKFKEWLKSKTTDMGRSR